ncbi:MULTISPECIES: hypothetical protein [Gordonia]|uniref:hypothetical protein n=1 Tax=Gordonia TaxID=2053 RepID=UPI0002A625AF|nr:MULTISPECIES: hypothetical protein [Gordonia]KAF0970197.1 hypothetical protein BPODLACK_01250 [Gordonia sp. YY1]UPW15683.1 hypothetical protein M0655_09205 [Gordonia amicalis]GAC51610.1 hypothetical protein GOAMI_02_00570 [Gordonia amicalis NBRC 100051 = JCM 11271]
MTSSLDSAGRRDAPPSVDLFGHFRDLARVALPAILIGLLVGACVFGLRTALVPKEYSATVVAEITPSGDIIPGDAYIEQMRAPFIALSTDENVLQQVLTQVDTGWDTTELREHVTTGPGTTPSLLLFTATAPSSEQAENVARAMVTAISAAAISNHARDISRVVDQLRAQITAERARNRALPDRGDSKAESNATLADLNSQLTRLQNSSTDSLAILAAPSAGAKPIAPNPTQEGAVAAIAATILAAELLVLIRGRAGRTPNPIWARRIAHKYGAQLSYDDATAGPGLPDTVLPALAQRHRRAQVALILTGSGVDADGLVDRTAPPADDAAGHPMRLERLPLTEPWWQRVDPGDLALAVVTISTAGTDRSLAERALAQFAEIGINRHLVVLRRPPVGADDTLADDGPPPGPGVDVHTPRAHVDPFPSGDVATTAVPSHPPRTPAHRHSHGRPFDSDRFRVSPLDASPRDPRPQEPFSPNRNGTTWDMGDHAR